MKRKILILFIAGVLTMAMWRAQPEERMSVQRVKHSL